MTLYYLHSLIYRVLIFLWVALLKVVHVSGSQVALKTWSTAAASVALLRWTWWKGGPGMIPMDPPWWDLGAEHMVYRYIYISHKRPFYDHLGKMNGHMIWSLTLIGCPIFRQSHFQIVGTCWNILVNLNDSVMFTRNSVTPRKMKVVFFPGKLAETNQGNEELLSGIDPQNNDCSGISWTNIGI